MKLRIIVFILVVLALIKFLKIFVIFYFHRIFSHASQTKDIKGRVNAMEVHDDSNTLEEVDPNIPDITLWSHCRQCGLPQLPGTSCAAGSEQKEIWTSYYFT